LCEGSASDFELDFDSLSRKMTPENKSLDLLGMKPVAQAIDRTTEASLKGAGAFLSRICLPAAEEFGLLLKDRVSFWRAKNAAKIAAKAERMIASEKLPLRVHPRLAWEIVDKGSWAEDDLVQDMWAGLLASSCSSHADDGNILFVSLLERLTGLEVRLIKHLCETTPKFISASGLPYSEERSVPLTELSKITGVGDIHRLDRELDHLRSLELIAGGFIADDLATVGTDASIRITALALHLYVRGHGFCGSPGEYWKLSVKSQGTPPSQLNTDSK
jgi:hypothetical protein